MIEVSEATPRQICGMMNFLHLRGFEPNLEYFHDKRGTMTFLVF